MNIRPFVFYESSFLRFGPIVRSYLRGFRAERHGDRVDDLPSANRSNALDRHKLLAGETADLAHEFDASGLEQVLWPDHCVRGTPGAEFHPNLQVAHCELVIRMGYHREIDSYSAFFENDRQTPTGLAGYLRERGLTRLFVVGLATDFCIAYSALDARRLGFEVTVIEAGCRGIDVGGSLAAAWKQMEEAGVIRA